VPGDSSRGVRVRVSDTRDATVADVSDSTFTLNSAAP
jgi:hypothetical protein